MSNAKNLVTLYFDVISPPSWIAFESLIQFKQVLDISLQLRPFFLAAIMKETGNISPPRSKIEYSRVDLLRHMKYWGLEYKYPTIGVGELIKRGTLNPQRFLTVLEMNCSEYLETTAREFWTRLYQQNKSVHEEADIVCTKLKIPNSKQLLAQTNETQIKERLKHNTEEVLQKGAFGSPWIVLRKTNGEEICLFGSDRLHILCNELGYEFRGPLKNKNFLLK